MNPVKIRKMTGDDLDVIMDIEHRCFSVPWTREAFRMEVDENQMARYIVAEMDGNVIGYGGMWKIVDEGHITNIAVHPDYRSHGVGDEIVKGLIHIADGEGIHRLTLEVRKSNEAALHLYKRAGFESFGIRPRYYQDNHEDAVIMWREVNTF